MCMKSVVTEDNLIRNFLAKLKFECQRRTHYDLHSSGSRICAFDNRFSIYSCNLVEFLSVKLVLIHAHCYS